MVRRHCAATLALVLLLLPSAVRAQALGTIRIGVLNNMSGPYADFSGKGSVIAERFSATCGPRWGHPTSPPTCCRGNPPAPILSASPTPVMTW